MSTYFQGGDYIELLSAQGTTPAATWKLQGKITKAFEKTIRGNAFVLDGGTETKMQLPKNPSQPALGVAQRFLILQLHIPLARSFAVEISFADFQKIRRRFVFASAFRETVMNALHVQIPFGASVTRDRWMNLVFDLQALTEMYFSGSTFRSVESIYISGSCKLKRVFTMKDAPAWDHRQQASGAGSALVANHAEMREIPKQFVFSTTTSGSAPIPTEYFIMSACANGGSNGNGSGAVKKDAHAKAIPSGARKTTTATPRTQTTRPSSEQIRSNPTTQIKTRPLSGNGVAIESKQLQAPSPASVVVPAPVIEPREAAPAVQLPSSSRPTTFVSKVGARMSREELQVLPPAPLSLRGSHRSHFDGSDEDNEQVQDSPPSEKRRHSPAKSKGKDDWRHSSNSSSSSASVKDNEQDRRLLSASPVYERRSFVTREPKDLHASKEKCRQAIVTEIQQKLDQLTANEEQEEERNQKLFLQHTSLRSSVGLGLEKTWDLRTRSLRSSVADDLCEHEAADDHGNEWEQQTSKLAELPQRQLHRDGSCSFGLKNIHAWDSTPPEKSIFAFSSHAEDTERPTTSSVKSLYDFDSLLGNTTELKQSIAMESHAVQSISPSRKDATDVIALSRAPSVALSPDAKAQEEDDELTLLLAAKRLARQWQREGRQHLMHAEQQTNRVSLEKRQEIDSEFCSSASVLHDDATRSMQRERVEEECDGNEDVVIDSEHESDEDDDLSIDLADELDQAGLEDPNENTHDASFDFGDLVHDQQIDQVEQTEAIDKQLQHSPQPHASPDRKTPVTRSQEQSKAAFSLSESKLVSPASINNCSSPIQTLSSSRRLQSLLDSTDWSQLSHSPLTPVLQHREQNRQQKQQTPIAPSPNSAGSTSIELVYDPLLHCYYDPVANKYYALAK